MLNRISDVRPVDTLASTRLTATQAAGGSFAEIFANALQQVEASGRQAAQAADRFMAGETDDIHSVALAGQRASLEFDYLLQVRNKVVQAYQEVMRMQL